MKILISGGHLSPALAFIEYVKDQKKDEIIFVGRSYSQHHLKQKSREREEVETRGIPFIEFEAGKSSHNFFTFCWLFVKSLWKAHVLFKNEKPDVFVSFGSYVAVPLAIVAKLHHVPILIHEQTRTVGQANGFIAQFATKIAVSFEETTHRFPSQKTVLTGNPLRKILFDKNLPLPSFLKEEPKLPILYITGGSQGSEIINNTVAGIIPNLTQEWCVIHQCGHPNLRSHYKQKLEENKAQLPLKQQENYSIVEWVTETQLGWIYMHCAAVVSRSGANTVQEILSHGKPAIFIPLPRSHENEQLKSAEAAVRTGGALILHQSDLTSQKLLETLTYLRMHYGEFAKKAQDNQNTFHPNAAEMLYQLAIQIADHKK